MGKSQRDARGGGGYVAWNRVVFLLNIFRCLPDMVSRAMGSTSMFIQATTGRGNKRRRRGITGGKADMSRPGMAMAETARRWLKNLFSDFIIE